MCNYAVSFILSHLLERFIPLVVMGRGHILVKAGSTAWWVVSSSQGPMCGFGSMLKGTSAVLRGCSAWPLSLIPEHLPCFGHTRAQTALQNQIYVYLGPFCECTSAQNWKIVLKISTKKGIGRYTWHQQQQLSELSDVVCIWNLNESICQTTSVMHNWRRSDYCDVINWMYLSKRDIRQEESKHSN